METPEKTSSKTLEKALFLVTIVLLITVGALGWFLKKQTVHSVEVERQLIAITDTVKVGRNNLGQQTAKIITLEASNTKSFLKIQNLNGELKKLQDVVKFNESRLGPSGSVTIFDSNTSVKTTTPTKVISKDSIRIVSTKPNAPDTIKLYPEYQSPIELGKWVTGLVIANKDSISTKFNIHNEYSLVNGEESIPGTGFIGLFRKKKSFSEVTNLNPYSETSSIRTFNVKDTKPQKRLSLGIQTGYSPFTVNKTYIGIGVNFKILDIL